uniref:Histone acetyltransferase n=1 Tax=Davidia involucrata TaxID=16924 RepID=A0A5B6Z0X7_DAVIN
MPRPGPRPYECVRRAWHSDRHQPMRGSIIQQIFRVVHESHSSATKKNKEWQEKLPIVVFKAEEIMYSRANSEAEYTSLETLWDRVNEAINTIIRRDESMETGELLPPCVEAALNLGCVQVRASRSQRHSNPRSYLSPRAQEPGFVPPKILDNTTNERNSGLPPLHSSNQINFARSMSSTHLVSESNRHLTQNSNPTASCNFPLSCEKFPHPGNNQFNPMESNTSLNVGSVYPLYYGTDFQPDMSRLICQNPKNSNTIIVGTPIFSSIPQPAEVACLQNLFSCDGDENASNRTTQSDFRDNHEKAPEMECDLSLRLGLFSDPHKIIGTCSSHDNDDVGSSSSQEGSRFSNLSPPTSKEFSFFPIKTANYPFEFHTKKWISEGEDQIVEADVRKRKAPFNNDVEDGKFFWPPTRMKRPGL